MAITIFRPFNAAAQDPFEIQISKDAYDTIVLHAKDRPGSDRILIALLENLVDAETKS